MNTVQTQIRRSVYYDSVVLMQLQKSLGALPGVLDAGVIMCTDANKQLLAQSHLLTPEAEHARAEDLAIAIRAEDETAAAAALAQVEELLKQRRQVADEEYRPKSLEAAVQRSPEARWVLISIPGRYAADVARQALALGRHVFLYSDNLSLADEVQLKQTAREKGLLVMGPDCGTAIINGCGLGFANRVRRGRIGIVGASGTGIQTISIAIHRAGEGVSHAIGTGTRDLSDAVGAVTTLQGLDILRRDPHTDVIVLVSKPPSVTVAGMVVEAAQRCGKPVVVNFIGYVPSTLQEANLYFASTLEEAAEQAVERVIHHPIAHAQRAHDLMQEPPTPGGYARGQRYLRGLYSGGTLAYEAQLVLGAHRDIYSNAPLDPARRLASPASSREHAIIVLGADEFMVGRLHPMIDNDLRIRRLRQEAADPEVAVLLLDVLLGYGAHPDPARELAEAIADVKLRATQAGRTLEVVAAVIGTDEDVQDHARQMELLRQAGAWVESSHLAALRRAESIIPQLNGAGRIAYKKSDAVQPVNAQEKIANAVTFTPVDLSAFQESFAAINIGLEGFFESLKLQNVPTIQVDWRPPAGGNEKLMAILARMKNQ